MSYTADDDLLTVMPERTLMQLSADDPMAGVPDWDVVAEARAYADGQIDARIRQRYSLPLTSVPRELRDWALALARRWLYERRPDGADIPLAVKEAAKEAITALDAVRDGKMSLDTGEESVAAEAVTVRIIAPDRLFTSTLLANY